MKYLYYTLLASLCCFFTSCISVKGPVIFNGTGFDISFVARFSDGHEIQADAKNRTGCWLSYDQSSLSELHIRTNNVQVYEVAGSLLTEWQKNLGKDELLIILLRPSEGARITHKELKKLCREANR